VRGLLNMDVIDEAAVSAKYGIPGRAYADFAALRGDPSDGLPGVPGVGEKTAAALIRTFGSIEGITTALDAGHGGFPRGSREKLERARDYLDIAMSVVRVVDDVPLPAVDGRLPAVPPDAVRLQDLGERWGLGSSLSRFIAAVSEHQGLSGSPGYSDHSRGLRRLGRLGQRRPRRPAERAEGVEGSKGRRAPHTR
jgi:5'-3' exonuclease, C-terminal SAM fold